MRGRIHLLRHAEGIHALRRDTSIPDAPLTERGFDYAEDLGRRFV
jgi:broad specificity phosphatase PhoE